MREGARGEVVEEGGGGERMDFLLLGKIGDAGVRDSDEYAFSYEKTEYRYR